MQEFIENLTGDLSVGKFLAAFVFSLVGVALSLLYGTTKRDPNSNRTPLCFSWDFFWSDNMKRILKSAATTILTVFVSLRFTKELLGFELSMVIAFLIGLCLDRIAEVLKQKQKTAFVPPTEDQPIK